MKGTILLRALLILSNTMVYFPMYYYLSAFCVNVTKQRTVVNTCCGRWMLMARVTEALM
jgi:hypothetical protein